VKKKRRETKKFWGGIALRDDQKNRYNGTHGGNVED
jgi:hypothetical protein